ncbi:MAG: hypothetical protein D6726_05960, partial [Nitrospirae bacterium]
SEFVNLLSNFGEDKILFGTDSPWTDQTEMVNRILGLPVGDDLKEKILFRNARVFLKCFNWLQS